MTTQADDALYQHPWKLVEIGPLGTLRPIPPEFTITLQFDRELRAHGASACNRYFAAYHVDGPRLRFQQIGATRMMCPGPAMALEGDYFAALEQVETYQLQEDQLMLSYDQGKSLLRFHASYR